MSYEPSPNLLDEETWERERSQGKQRETFDMVARGLGYPAPSDRDRQPWHVHFGAALYTLVNAMLPGLNLTIRVMDGDEPGPRQTWGVWTIRFEGKVGDQRWGSELQLEKSIAAEPCLCIDRHPQSPVNCLLVTHCAERLAYDVEKAGIWTRDHPDLVALRLKKWGMR